MEGEAGVVPPAEHCTATRHGDADAYQHHNCRCPQARNALRLQRKRLQLAHLRGLTPLVDATGTRRRLQALAAIGHSLTDLGHALDRTANTVHTWQTQAVVVSRETAEAVSRIYETLSDRPGSGPRVDRVRNDAARKGWLPPMWWDDDTIEIKDHDPLTYVDYKNDFINDEVAIARWVNGDRSCPLTKGEKKVVFKELLARGATLSGAAQRLGLNGVYARRYALEAGLGVGTSSHSDGITHNRGNVA